MSNIQSGDKKQIFYDQLWKKKYPQLFLLAYLAVIASGLLGLFVGMFFGGNWQQLPENDPTTLWALGRLLLLPLTGLLVGIFFYSVDTRLGRWWAKQSWARRIEEKRHFSKVDKCFAAVGHLFGIIGILIISAFTWGGVILIFTIWLGLLGLLFDRDFIRGNQIYATEPMLLLMVIGELVAILISARVIWKQTQKN